MFCLHALESGERAEEMPFSLEKGHSRKLSSVQFADREGNKSWREKGGPGGVHGQAGQHWGWVGWRVQRGDYYGLGEINRVGFER